MTLQHRLQKPLEILGWDCTDIDKTNSSLGWLSKLFRKTPKLSPQEDTTSILLCTSNNIPEAVILICSSLDSSLLAKLNTELTRSWCKSGKTLKGIVITSTPVTSELDTVCKTKDIGIITLEALQIAASDSTASEATRQKIMRTAGSFMPD